MRRDLKMLKRMMMLMGIGLACSVGGADVQGLAEPAMEVLPLGSVRPTDWLAEQLLKQCDGHGLSVRRQGRDPRPRRRRALPDLCARAAGKRPAGRRAVPHVRVRLEAGRDH